MIQGINFEINAAPDGRFYSMYPSGVLPNTDNSGMALGANLTEVNYFDSNRPLRNLIKQSEGWTLVSGTGPYTINLQDQIVSLSGDTILRKNVMLNHGDPNLPLAGEYTIRKPLGSNIEYSLLGLFSFTGDTVTTITIPTGQAIILEVQSPDGSEVSLDDFTICLTSELAVYDSGEQFTQTFIDDVLARNYQTLRSLNWIKANANLNDDFAERTLPTALSFSGTRPKSGGLEAFDNGNHRMHVPWELIIDICNKTNTNCWINVPVRYTQASRISLAQLIESELESGLDLFVEDANESWNFVFRRTLIWTGLYGVSLFTVTGTAGSNVVTFNGVTPTEGMQIKLTHHEDAELIAQNEFDTDQSVFTVNNVSGQTGELDFGGAANLPAGSEIFYGYDAAVNPIDDTTVDIGAGQRAQAVWADFEANITRVIEKPIGSQIGYIQRTQRRIGATGTNGTHTTVAIAPYPQVNSLWQAGDTVQDVADQLLLPFDANTMNLATADQYIQDVIDLGVTAIDFYESNFHFLWGGVADKDTLYNAFNKSAQAGTLFTEMYRRWAAFDEVRSALVYRGFYGQWGTFGYWDIEEYVGQNLPRSLALTAFNGFVARDYVPPVDVLTTARQYIYGHSLANHQVEGASRYTQIQPVIADIASHLGNTFFGSGRFGQIVSEDNHPTTHVNNLPGPNDWNYTDVNTLTGDPDQVMLLFPNFTQAVPLDSLFLNGALTVIDNAETEWSPTEYHIYSHWRETDPSFEPEAATQTAWNAELTDAQNRHWNWHVDAAAQIRTARPNITVKVFPVGAIIAQLIQNNAFVSQLSYIDFYVDDAPHGTENTYFLAGLIIYLCMYKHNTAPDMSGFTVPSDVNVLISDNLQSITNDIVTHLNTYNQNEEVF